MGQRKPRPMKCEGHLTSRGEQLLQRHWEETAMCISYEHYDVFLCSCKPFIVQRSYAHAAPLPNRRRRGIEGQASSCF